MVPRRTSVQVAWTSSCRGGAPKKSWEENPSGGSQLAQKARLIAARQPGFLMNAVFDAKSRSALCALLDLTDRIEQNYSRASEQLAEPGPKALVGYLAIQHAEHRDDLRDYALKNGIQGASLSSRDHSDDAAWSELRMAIASDRREVVVAACQLTEQLVFRAYKFTSEKLPSHSKSFQLLKRHMHDIESTLAFVRTISADDFTWDFETTENGTPLASAWRSVDKTSFPAEVSAFAADRKIAG